MITKKPSYLNFNSTNYVWKKNVNYRKSPELYRVGKGEQGVLICEPYKSEILPHWAFKTLKIAKSSSLKIYRLFKNYLKKNDFVGADMARKYLQMGYTRSRRYANYKGGKKYAGLNYHLLVKGTGDPEKAKSAEAFYKMWKKAENTLIYKKLKKEWKSPYG